MTIKKIFQLTFLLILIPFYGISAQSTEVIVECRFTSFFAEKSSDFDPVFNRFTDSDDFKAFTSKWVEEAFIPIEHFNFKPLTQSISQIDDIATKVEPNTLFIRGIVSRADVKKVEHFSTDEFVFSTNASIEFFDLVSGEVFYTRTLTGQVFVEKPKETGIPDDEKRVIFEKCLKGTISELARLIGEDYSPGVLEGNIIKVLDDETVIIDLGLDDGLYQGMSFYYYNKPGSPPSGLLKTEKPQQKFTSSRIIISQDSSLRKGMIVKSFGVNKLSNQKGITRYMVAEFSAANPEDLDPDFKVDSQSLGQWLHDGLSGNSDLFMLAPLLANLDSSGKVSIQNALQDAQLNYSIFGGLAQSAAMGNRGFPDVLVKGVITHAGIQTYITPGAENKVLEVGISVEFYDRKTRDYIYSCQNSKRKVEKVSIKDGKVYRNLKFESSFRDLCKDLIRETTEKISAEYHPLSLVGNVVSVESDKLFEVSFNREGAQKGDLFNLSKKKEEIKDLEGESLGNFTSAIGIAKLTEPLGKNGFKAQVLVSDGINLVEKGNILSAEGRNDQLISGGLNQVIGWRAEGKIDEGYEYSTRQLTEWLHDALLTTGGFRLLPPNFREGSMGIVEVGMALGQFEMRDQKDIIYQGVRVPEILISGRLGLAEYSRKKGEFKDKLNLTVGVQVTFTDVAGDTLFTKKLAGKREIEQVKSRGETVVGTEDLSPEFDDLTHNTIINLVRKIAEEYKLK